MRNLDEVFDIYEGFLNFVGGDFGYTEVVKVDNAGNESGLIKVSNGFSVELTNVQNVKNSAALRCWWNEKECAIEVQTIEQLIAEFQCC